MIEWKTDIKETQQYVLINCVVRTGDNLHEDIVVVFMYFLFCFVFFFLAFRTFSAILYKKWDNF